MPVDLEQLSRNVAALIDRHGQDAVVFARKRVDAASRTGDLPALDLALMVLTEVERRQSPVANL